MKNLISLSLIILLFSCSGKKDKTSTNILENMSYTVDTILIDSGNELMLLEGDYVGNYALSPSLDKMFIFSEKAYVLQEVDLDKLKLIGKKEFEKEGPNGVGDYIQAFNSLNNGDLVFSDFKGTGVFTLEGENIAKHFLKSSDIEGIDLKDDFPINSKARIFGDGDFLYGINPMEADYQLVEVNLDANTGRQLPLKALNLTKDFQTMLTSNGSGMFFSISPKIEWVNNLLLATSPATNEIYVLEKGQDSLKHFSFPHKLVPLAKKGIYNQNSNSREEFMQIMEDINNQVNFGRFYWDESSKQYFRLSQIGLPKIDPDSKKKYENFIHTYNQDFELIGEAKLDGIDQKLTNDVFFKDGKLWSFVNVNDELGFAVFTFDF